MDILLLGLQRLSTLLMYENSDMYVHVIIFMFIKSLYIIKWQKQQFINTNQMEKKNFFASYIFIVSDKVINYIYQ